MFATSSPGRTLVWLTGAFLLAVLASHAAGQQWSNPLSQRSDRWVCYAVSQTFCTGQKCLGHPSQTVIHLDFLTGHYTRCADGACNELEIQTQDLGFRMLSLTASGFGLRVRIDAFDFAEVATTEEGQVTLLGRCGPA